MSSQKLEWMYKGVSGLVDREEYLTGRRIDKTLEIIDKEESKKGDFDDISDIPPSIFASSGQVATVTVDLEAKQREDPLYEIRKRQQEQRRKLVDNPVKMKRLKNLLEDTLKEGKQKKNKRKSKKRRRHESSESSTDTESDGSGDREKSSKAKIDLRNFKESLHRKADGKKEESERDWRHDKRARERGHSYKETQRNQSNDSRTRNFQKPQSKLTAEEMEKRRREMMKDAEWREEQRKSNVKSYKREEEEEEKQRGAPAQFIKPMLKKAAEINSLEDRIRQRKFTSQRMQESMDKHFARK